MSGLARYLVNLNTVPWEDRRVQCEELKSNGAKSSSCRAGSFCLATVNARDVPDRATA